MSKRINRSKKQKPDKLSDVSTLIEECRKNQATELDLSGRGLAELPESINSEFKKTRKTERRDSPG